MRTSADLLSWVACTYIAGGFDHGWGELDQGAVQDVEATRRLALCNMDWDRIKANDLMLLLSSFLPPGGVIRSVTVSLHNLHTIQIIIYLCF